ncbi:L,D-transpeptidase [Flavobacterium jejuense]|uniref:L,D-transpeptidase n=1 Tax=Flavobacterium jejuense TaxID=1544455 RepID=A0ABX0IP40_9FLAO|nr:L,D-transpeptidase [Flavobacterium jejuense]NHN24253.1 L,D-transpeptidase [Flavobacterium jejuense]
MKRITGFILLSTFILTSCNKEETIPNATLKRTIPERKKPKSFTYSYLDIKKVNIDSLKQEELDIILGVNRMDETNIKKTDSILVPTDLSGDITYYLPFPFEIKALDSVKKIIFFSYPSETFATYEYGILTHEGPTNMGKEIALTPTGLFFTNWKAKETISTVNDEWHLKWNFNIANGLGVGFHQYELPGYPASHSCMRLREKDAKMLYNFAEQWVLENEDSVKVKGTPVIIFGKYDFKAPKPWLALKTDPNALKTTEDELNRIIKPHIKTIKKEEKIRDAYTTNKN